VANIFVLSWALALFPLSSQVLGFASPRQRNPLKPQSTRQKSHLFMVRINESDVTRADFLSNSILSSLVFLVPNVANGFDGGVGGLGKTRPQTGVVFRDPEAAAETTQSSSGDVNYELIAPDGTPVFLSFSAPYPLLKSAAGIEARDVAGGFESSYVQVVELPNGVNSVDKIKPALLSENIFGSSGKFGMYGVPTDIKIKSVSSVDDINSSGKALYQASFTTLTPAMRESDRKAYISASVVGNGLFLLVTTTTSARFKKLEGLLRQVADSFTAISAPKSSLRKSS